MWAGERTFNAIRSCKWLSPAAYRFLPHLWGTCQAYPTSPEVIKLHQCAYLCRLFLCTRKWIVHRAVFDPWHLEHDLERTKEMTACVACSLKTWVLLSGSVVEIPPNLSLDLYRAVWIPWGRRIHPVSPVQVKEWLQIMCVFLRDGWQQDLFDWSLNNNKQTHTYSCTHTCTHEDTVCQLVCSCCPDGFTSHSGML